MTSDMPRAKHMQIIQPFRVMALLAEARMMQSEGRSVIHLEVGEPDFDTPQPIIEAGIQALQQGHTHYTPATGDPDTRQAISQYYQDQFDVVVDPRRIIVTPGASGALQLVLSVLLNPGDDVLMSDPGYPCNRNFVRLLNANPLMIPVDETSGFQLTHKLVKQSWSANSNVLLLASPSNPTGTLIQKSEMQSMLNFVANKRGAVIVDEIYQGITYDVENYTALEFSDDVFVINSFSKYFGMTGWRVGWIVAPQAYVDDLDTLAQNLFLAASTPSQIAAQAAFLPETRLILQQRVEILQERRNFLLSALPELGFIIPQIPQGAFYIYADCSRLTDDSFQFCHALLQATGVAITPGLDFGDSNPQQYVRFAYTTDLPQLKEAITRISDFLKGAYV